MLRMFSMLFVLTLTVAVPVLLIYLAFRLLRDRRGQSNSFDSARMDMYRLESRMERLEESVMEMRDQLDQIVEGQRFTTRVLSERERIPRGDAP